jgi:hypothetical protein
MTGRLRHAAVLTAFAVLNALCWSLPGAKPGYAHAPPTPQQNREAIERDCANGGTCTLPAGVTVVDSPPVLSSRCTLQGDPAKGSTLSVVSGGLTINALASGLGYTEAGHVAQPVAVGEWLYRFKYDAYVIPGSPAPLLCRVVKVASDGYQTSPAPDPRHDAVLRFGRAWPVGQPKEGDTVLALANVPATGLSAGMAIYVCDGPSVANASRGEHRRIVSVSGNRATLDRPLRQAYGNAVIASVGTLENVTVRNVVVAAPATGALVGWSAQFKGASGLRLERCHFAGICDVVSSGGAVVSECSGPALQFNTSVGCRVERCSFGAFYAEEAAGDIDVVDCEFGVGRAEPQNCCTGWFACERLRFTRCRVVGAGRAQWPPPSAFHLHGREMSVIDCETCAHRGGSTYLGGDGLTVRGLRSDAGVFVTSGKGASISHVRGPHVEFYDGSGGVAVDVAKLWPVAGQGWQQIACEPWSATGFAVPQRAPAPKQRQPMYHRGKR